ncbi:MAG: cation-translocating P-type ATPase [Synechococcaceae cyanobacterium]|nr:cation-translocating P-type ATPase [Synechococcaceae cyanobacterium]
MLEVDGMKCGGCVRAVEQRLRQQNGVRAASVNLLTRTAWVELEPVQPDPLPAVLESLAALGFPARPRQQGEEPAGLRERRRQRSWWQQWRQLVVAILLVLVSGLGHLADAGTLPWLTPQSPLGRPALHALVATGALLGPGRPILRQAWHSLRAGLPGMDLLVSLGVLSAYGASLVGWLWPASGFPCFFHEPVMLLGFVLTGRFLEERARWRTGRAIEELAALQPDHALLLLGDGPPRRVRVGGLRPGDRLRILPGDRLPVDGVVREGCSSLDVSALTGEPLPQTAAVGSALAAGSLNLEAPLVLEVSRSGAESAIARIVQLVERAQARKAPIQGLADRVAGGFATGVLVLALATFLFWWLWGGRHWPELLQPAMAGHGLGGLHGGGGVHGLGALGAAAPTPLALALQLAIAVLVVACPCALGLATPTALSVGLGRAARAGLLFRGGDAIETAARLEVVFFDKTGTLTLGRPLVTNVAVLEAADAAELLTQAAALEQQSRHPFAHALLQEAANRGLVLPALESCRAEVGSGVEGRLVGGEGLVRVGRLGWLQALGVRVDGAAEARAEGLEAEGASLLAVAAAERLLGLVAVRDAPRADAADTLARLRAQGLALGLLSGDRRAGVEALGAALGLPAPELAWELRPDQKLARLEARRGEAVVAMVGDGINDAPALAAADLGIAIGTGTQIAQESAGLVVMGDRLQGIPEALEIARRTMAKVRQNLAWAFGYNLLVLPIAAGVLLPRFGLLLSPPLAALLMATSSLTVVLNALLLQDGPRSERERPA